MTTPTILADKIINKLKDSGDYELNRNKTKFDKRKKDTELVLGKLEEEVRNLRADAYVLDEEEDTDSPEIQEALSKAKHQIKEKKVEIEATRLEKDTIKLVLSKLDKMIDENNSKKNTDLMLKYLKSSGITTVEQLKAALAKSI